MTQDSKWTRQLRYQSYEDWPSDYLGQLKEKVAHSPWRQHYHIQPESGLLNDPNGFSYYNGRWQLFYQYYPMGPVHGLKSWYHLSSKDLVHWESHGIALEPDSPYDSHGVYSGSALPVGNQLFIFYTGNARDDNWQRHPYQVGAWMDKDYQFTKIDPPLIGTVEEGYTDHFRDPQIFPYQDGYLMILGAQTEALKGQILVYQSDDLKDWNFLGPLQLTSGDSAYMMECPNYVKVDGQDLLIFCPQGLDQDELNYQNIYPNTYLSSESIDWENLTLSKPSALKNLDDGFDVYATQAFNAPDGRALAVSWLGLPDLTYPDADWGWTSVMSLVKELHFDQGHLYQRPVKEMESLRQTPIAIEETLESGQAWTYDPEDNAYEINCSLAADSKLDFLVMSDEKEAAALHIDVDVPAGRLKVTRTEQGELVNPEYGPVRKSHFKGGEDLQLQIFIDASSFEIFVQDGYRVLSGRIFPKKGQNQLIIKGSGRLGGRIYPLENINK
ncbi:sucrose-6-phosphate hydrolase [Aerococcus urinae]|uniref:Sucrose-6-phosphate hydrolase n=1 Tax=Aerococcus urinae TaxID=1376 RepID=A0A109REQ7_9LACT|nr:sucrose-6-phosphate hydrolase [Aerococcus urinae]AMB96160.1 sucrose-6-phosphate hydrolase [Aerococcus urinae]MCY3033204.1 sucrose-6-phosphate hydrolase [Aerococcus urinae]MCY3038436.1 sucrose-6-phosphate hydrolase [Aerococcus urinae]MCY3045353.1 sucrose-6-phosphate hydrolase [Aerococcus urinae]MCY3047093.1 sucrose-6-phosphate hydrolase [Aerococcus urinae]